MDFSTLIEKLQKLPFKIIGVGVTAFPRVMGAFFWPNYGILCFKNSLDNLEIGKKCKVVSVEKEWGVEIKKLSTLEILRLPQVIGYLAGEGKNLALLVYKPSKETAKICKKNGWRLIGNMPEIRDPFENKKIFREILQKVGVEPIGGETMSLADFNGEVFLKMQEKYGKMLVLKLPEVTTGGGLGISFVRNDGEFEQFKKKAEGLGKNFKLKNLIIEREIEGISPSITGCVTHFGILTGLVQTQITDIPEVISLKRGGGMFVGHDWSFSRYSENVEKQVENICRRFGEYISQKGYRGIFGIDLLVERGTEKVYACECNPRLTGAFPVFSMIQWSRGEPPFELFNLLELFGVDYQVDLAEVQRLYKEDKEGSHLICFEKEGNWWEVEGELKAGVFKFENGELKFVRLGFSFLDLQSAEEFVLTDGVPAVGALIRPYSRILKIIFPGRILAEGGKEIDERTKEIVEATYRNLKLKAIESRGNVDSWEGE